MNPELTLEELEQSKVLQTVVFPLIVPTEEEVLNSKDLDLSKSAINACYSKPEIQENGLPQSWFDVQLTVEGVESLPPRKEWFYIVTEKGYVFKGRFSGKKVKKLSSFENTRIIGVWLKSIFVSWEFVEDFDFVKQDRRRTGIITKEILEELGGDKVFLKKTDKTWKDGKGVDRDIWLISFPYTLTV